MQPQDSQPHPHGSRQSRRNNFHHGRDSPSTKFSAISQTRMKPIRDIFDVRSGAYDLPNEPKPLQLQQRNTSTTERNLASSANRNPSFSKCTKLRRRPLPKQSNRGNQYIMLLVERDSSAILVELMKYRTAGEKIRAYQTLIKRLKRNKGKTSHLAVLCVLLDLRRKIQIKQE